MRMRGALPLIAVWDDHEFTNNAFRTGAQNHNNGDNEDPALPWELRAANAVRAYFEYMPIRPASQSPEDRHRIYRQFQFGKLASLLMLDTRLTGRDPEQPSQPFNTSDMRYFNSSRSLLGKEQRKWVRDNLLKAKDDRVTWKVLGQQIVFAPAWRFTNGAINTDGWDGYAAERERILDTIEQHAIDNVVVLTGDVHSSFAMDVPREQFKAYEPETGPEPALQQVPWPGSCPALQQVPWPGSCPARVPALQQVPWPGTSPAQVPALQQQVPWPGASPAQLPALQQAVASNYELKQVKQQGLVVTSLDVDWSVTVDVANLKPKKVYYYQFIVDGTASMIGRSKTLPRANDRALERVNLAVASCAWLIVFAPAWRFTNGAINTDGWDGYAEMAWKTGQIEEVQERIKKAEDWIKVLKALPVKDEFESVSLVETEKRLILMRKEEAIYLQVEVLEEAEEVARRPSEAQCLTPSQRQRFTQQQYQQPGLQQQVSIKPFTLSGVVWTVAVQAAYAHCSLDLCVSEVRLGHIGMQPEGGQLTEALMQQYAAGKLGKPRRLPRL
ncbi:PhoD-like phosphatase-domain-containing protein [Haematococcus lacustris]